MAIMDGFVAFAEQDAKEVMSQGRIGPRTFGRPFKWVPFANSADGAIQKAMMSKGPPEAATEATVWCVLQISFTAEQFLEHFKEQRVFSVTSWKIPGWRFYGDVELGKGNSCQWWEFKVAQIGIANWAEKALTARGRKRCATGVCNRCGAVSVPTWTGRKLEEFCAECWNRFFKEHAKERNADQMPEDVAMQEIEALNAP